MGRGEGEEKKGDSERNKNGDGDGDGGGLSARLVMVCGTSTCHLAVSERRMHVPGVWGPYWSGEQRMGDGAGGVGPGWAGLGLAKGVLKAGWDGGGGGCRYGSLLLADGGWAECNGCFVGPSDRWTRGDTRGGQQGAQKQ